MACTANPNPDATPLHTYSWLTQVRLRTPPHDRSAFHNLRPIFPEHHLDLELPTSTSVPTTPPLADVCLPPSSLARPTHPASAHPRPTQIAPPSRDPRHDKDESRQCETTPTNRPPDPPWPARQSTRPPRGTTRRATRSRRRRTRPRAAARRPTRPGCLAGRATARTTSPMTSRCARL